MSNWQAGAFNTKCKTDGDPYDVLVAGWINGPLAIDFRAFAERGEDWGSYDRPERGWCITHIPTGYVVQKVIGDLDTAKSTAEALLALGDWQAATIDSAKETFGAGVSEIRKALGDANGTNVLCIGPVKA